MDGANSFTAILITSDYTTITMDYSEQIIYWSSGYEVGSVNTDGSNYQIINRVLPQGATFLSLLENNILFYTTYGQFTVFLVNVNGTVARLPLIFYGCYGFADSKVLSQDRQSIQGRNK